MESCPRCWGIITEVDRFWVVGDPERSALYIKDLCGRCGWELYRYEPGDRAGEQMAAEAAKN